MFDQDLRRKEREKSHSQRNIKDTQDHQSYLYSGEDNAQVKLIVHTQFKLNEE
jgi:hypothetical protein